MSGMDTSGDTRIFSGRFRLFRIVLILWFVFYVIRLWQLQVLNGEELRRFSEKNLLKESKIAAPRGLIFDRSGDVLVENLPGFEVTISPQYTENLESTAKAISPIIGIATSDVISKVKTSRRRNGPSYPVRIKDNLSRDEVFRLKQLRLDHPGLDIQEVIVRSYPLKRNGVHLFGYVDEISPREIQQYNKRSVPPYRQGDTIGKSGLEEAFEKYLRGINGISFKQVDARGRETRDDSVTVLGQRVQNEPAVPGHNLYLTVDKDLQVAAHKAFKDHDKVGAMVALGAKGEVLAWASSPGFDPNVFSTRMPTEIWKELVNDPFKPLRNKVIQDHHPPGSTFKPLVALAALEEEVIEPNEKQSTPSRIRFGRRTYHDHTKWGMGSIDIKEAIERSSNVFFYRMGIALGIEKMHGYISQLGIGEKTGIKIEGEQPGLMPNSEYKLQATGEAWQPGENLSTAIGQGFVLATPLQMALAYLTIANEGKHYQPYVVKQVVSHEGEILMEQSSRLIRDISQLDSEYAISPETFRVVKQGLWQVNNGKRGTARWWKVPGVELSGKTGTVQIRSFSAEELFEDCFERPRMQRHHGWYVGYAPRHQPEIVVAVFAEHACSSSKAVPLARDLIQAYYEKYHPDIIKAGIEEQKRKWRARWLARKKAEQNESNDNDTSSESSSAETQNNEVED